MNDEKTTVAELRGVVDDFVGERQWHQFHDPKNLSMSIAIEAAELMEHFQWVKSDDLGEVLDDPKRVAEIRDELADVTAFVLSLANVMKIDLTSAVREKMVKNAAKYPAEQFRGRYK